MLPSWAAQPDSTLSPMAAHQQSLSTALRFWAPPDALTHVAQVYAVIVSPEKQSSAHSMSIGVR